MRFFKYLFIFVVCLSLTGCSKHEISTHMTINENSKTLEFKARTLKGNFLVAEADVKQECEYSFSLDISADAGKAKLILIKPDDTIEVLKEVAADTTHLCHGYMPNAGYKEAREAMAAKTSAEQGFFRNLNKIYF